MKKKEEEMGMNYSIKVTRLEKQKEGNVKGFAQLILDGGFKVTNIAILENKQTNQLYVSMLRYKSNELDEKGQNVYKNICNPITAEFREELFGNIMKAYESIPLEGKENSAEMDIIGEKEDCAITATVSTYERDNNNTKGFARVYFGDVFIVNNLSIMQGKAGMFLSMPAYKTKQQDEDGKAIYQSICYPVTKEFREVMYKEIVQKYEMELEKKGNKEKMLSR